MKLKITFALAILLALLPAAAFAQGGRPILTVRSYTVTPSPVVAGQEFSVEIEIYNNGSRAGENTMAVFSGGDFLPIGDAGHVLWQLHINHTVKVSQTMRVPATLSAGVHQLQVDLSANDYEGHHYDYPQAIPVEVVAPRSSAPSAPPKVVVESAETEPSLLAPGMPFTLTMRLANQGDRAATDLYVSCANSSPVVPVEGSTLAVERIGVGQAVTAAMPLELAWDVVQGGRLRIALDLDYHDTGGGTYRETQTIGIEVDTGLAPRPQIIVESYASEPASPMPGEPFTLTVGLRNVGTEAARRLSLTFGGADGAGLAPFLLLDTGPVAFLGDLGPGEDIVVARRFAVQEAASPQANDLTIALSYADGRGTLLNTLHSLSLIVQARPARSPQLVVTAYSTEPDFITPGDPLTLSLEVANVGNADARGLLLALGGQDGAALEPFMPVGSGNVLFVGDLAEGMRVQIVQPLIVDGATQARAYNLPLALTYTGPGGVPTTKVQRISLLVRRRVALQVEVYSRPESLAAKAPAQLSLEVRNVGRGTVDVVEMRATGMNVALQTEGTPFAGPLDAGGSAPLDLVLTPTKGGTVQLTVHVAYRDDLNRVQTWSQRLSFEVEAGQPPAIQTGTPEQEERTRETTFWHTVLRGIKGFLGFGS